MNISFEPSGHDYRTPTLVDTLEQGWPGIDVTPWRGTLTTSKDHDE